VVPRPLKYGTMIISTSKGTTRRDCGSMSTLRRNWRD